MHPLRLLILRVFLQRNLLPKDVSPVSAWEAGPPSFPVKASRNFSKAIYVAF